MKFLVIQTAFTGDVVLATPIVEKLRAFYPDAQIDFLLRKGNEGLLKGHPHIHHCWIWDKKQAKYRGLIKIAGQIRQEQYDWVINCQRFAAAGLLTVFSNARKTVGFSKNPFSWFFSLRVPHVFGTDQVPVHEVDRNLTLVRHLSDDSVYKPRLFPAENDYAVIRSIVPQNTGYVCLAPTSVWFTKQFPQPRWVELINRLSEKYPVFLLGGPSDADVCDQIVVAANRTGVVNLAGQLSFLESAALMQGALMNYVNDSAPLHFASAVDAPVTAIFCSTVPRFGFTPLSTKHHIVETQVQLHCRPCGLHGKRHCPEGHFACAESIQWAQIPFPS
ncbi:MAG: glycosyltransferase family 9 protein [Saprospiraceae bacterium]|nr:glycosyltransferase family 9 protein [Lewinellaceae bacterium]